MGRGLFVVGLAALALQRADLITPQQNAATVRSYEVIGFSVMLPPTITGPRSGTTTAPPFLVTPSLTIRYIDNLGTEGVDVHTDAATPALVAKLFDGTGSIRARLLQHLIDEKKIAAARVTK